MNKALIQLHRDGKHDHTVMNLMTMWKRQRNADTDTNPVGGKSLMTVGLLQKLPTIKINWHLSATMKYNRRSILAFAKESSYFSPQGKGGVSRKLTGLLAFLMRKL